MKKRSSSLLALMIVAVIALVLGSIGTAVAGPVLTKAKVKQIATKVVNKAAPNLSVKNAVTATNAANADKVDGFDANALARATGASTEASLGSFDSATFTTILNKSVTAPGPGLLVITASYEFNRLLGNANEAFVESRISLDGAQASAGIDGSDNHPAGVNASSANNVTVAVTAGTHDVALELRDTTTGAVFVGGRNLSIVFVPFGNAGAVGALGLVDLGSSGASNN
jgi:hypothetical protein